MSQRVRSPRVRMSLAVVMLFTVACSGLPGSPGAPAAGSAADASTTAVQPTPLSPVGAAAPPAGNLFATGSTPVAAPPLARADADGVSLAIRFSAGDPANPSTAYNGEAITYTIVVSNASLVYTATNVNVIDTLPANAIDSPACQSPCGFAVTQLEVPEPLGGVVLVSTTTGISFVIGSIGPAATASLSFAGIVIGQPDGTVLVNQADATYVLNGQNKVTTAKAQATVRLRLAQLGRAGLAQAPSWISNDLGGTISQDWADFDHDGFLDLALGSSTGVVIYRNVKGKLVQFWKDLQNRRAYGVRWADFDHDGSAEFVVVGASTDNTPATQGLNYVYRIAGTSAQQTQVFTSELQLVRVVVGDVDRDGYPDILGSTNSINATCAVMLFHNNAGTFTGPGQCISQPASAALSVADFNNDGWLDLAVGAFPNVVRVYPNAHTGFYTNTFREDTSIALERNLPFLPYDFAWGDYDGDGFLDLAAAYPLQREVRVYHNSGGTGFDSDYKVIKTATFMTPLSIDWGFFSGSGSLELAVADSSPRVWAYQGSGFSAVQDFQLPLSRGQTWSLRGARHSPGGDLDVSLTNRDRSSALFSSFAPRLSRSTVFTDSSPASSVAWGDANGDGALDLLLGAGPPPNTTARLYYNSNGSFVNVATIGAGLGPHSVAFGDVSGEGRLEIAIGTNTLNKLYANGDTAVADWESSLPDGPGHVIALGDADGDGKLDLLASSSGGGLALYLGRLSAFDTSPYWSTPLTGNITSLAWGDVNKDGYLDFAVGENPGKIRIFINQKDGTFAKQWESTAVYSTTGLSWADYNADGWLDLAAGNYGQPSVVFENLSGFPDVTPVWSSPTVRRTTAIAWGDWNNDGYPELALANDGELSQVFANEGSQPQFPALFWVWSSADQANATGVAWGDYNGDGYLDLAISTKGGGPNAIYPNISIQSTHLAANYRAALRTPNNPSYVSVQRPGATNTGYLYSSSEILGSPTAPTITVRYNVYDANNARPITSALDVAGISLGGTLFDFSLDGGGTWHPATRWTTSTAPITRTSLLGQAGTFVWDAQTDQAVSDNARIRVSVVNGAPYGPLQTASNAGMSPPFAVRALTCDWPSYPLFVSSPYTPQLSQTASFIGFIAGGSGIITYTWDFGDRTVVARGQTVDHTFIQNGMYTVTLDVQGEACPVARDVIYRHRVAVGTGVAPTSVFLPSVMSSSSISVVVQRAANAAPVGPAQVTDVRGTFDPATARLSLAWNGPPGAQVARYQIYAIAAGPPSAAVRVAETPGAAPRYDGAGACATGYFIRPVLADGTVGAASAATFVTGVCK